MNVFSSALRAKPDILTVSNVCVFVKDQREIQALHSAKY